LKRVEKKKNLTVQTISEPQKGFKSLNSQGRTKGITGDGTLN